MSADEADCLPAGPTPACEYHSPDNAPASSSASHCSRPMKVPPLPLVSPQQQPHSQLQLQPQLQMCAPRPLPFMPPFVRTSAACSSLAALATLYHSKAPTRTARVRFAPEPSPMRRRTPLHSSFGSSVVLSSRTAPSPPTPLVASLVRACSSLGTPSSSRGPMSGAVHRLPLEPPSSRPPSQPLDGSLTVRSLSAVPPPTPSSPPPLTANRGHHHRGCLARSTLSPPRGSCHDCSGSCVWCPSCAGEWPLMESACDASDETHCGDFVRTSGFLLRGRRSNSVAAPSREGWPPEANRRHSPPYLDREAPAERGTAAAAWMPHPMWMQAGYKEPEDDTADAEVARMLRGGHAACTTRHGKDSEDRDGSQCRCDKWPPVSGRKMSYNARLSGPRRAAYRASSSLLTVPGGTIRAITMHSGRQSRQIVLDRGHPKRVPMKLPPLRMVLPSDAAPSPSLPSQIGSTVMHHVSSSPPSPPVLSGACWSSRRKVVTEAAEHGKQNAKLLPPR